MTNTLKTLLHYRSRLLRALAVFLLIAVALSGCATGTDIDVRYAPEIKLKGVRSVKVTPFRVSPCHNSSGSYSIKEIVGEALVDTLIDVASEAIFGPDDDLKAVLHASLTEGLVRNGAYRVSNGEDYDAQISGDVTCGLLSRTRQRSTKGNDGKESIYYELEQEANVRVRFAIHNKTGETLGAGEVSASEEDASTASSLSELRYSARDPDSLIKAALDQSAELLVQKVAPYVVRERRTFATNQSPAVTDGIEAAKRGNWAQATALWNKAARSDNPSERMAALHNLAIYDEIQGEFRQAQEKYEQLYAIAQERRYKRELNRIGKRIAGEAWLRSEFDKNGGGNR